MKRLSVYLAGPEVFLSNATSTLARKIEICREFGWEGLSPVDNDALIEGDARAMARMIYQGNVAMMERADAIIANITPFRGPHMDPGTAFEIGYFAHAGKPIVVYTQQADDLVERVSKWSGIAHLEQGDEGIEIRDRNYHLVENFGLMENLMIEGALDHQGRGARAVVAPVDFDKVFSCTVGFEAAARELSRLLANAGSVAA